MKKTNLALMTMLALSVTATTQAQLVNNGGTITVQSNAKLNAADRPERQPNPVMVEARADIQADREALGALREEQQAEAEARRAETKEMGEGLREEVKAGEIDKEAAKVQMEEQRAANVSATVSAKEARVEVRSSIATKRQAMIDARIAAVREKSPELADIMQKYYGEIMAKIAEVEAKQAEMIASVKAGTMTAADAKVEFKAYVATEKAGIQSLMAELKAEVSTFREAQKASNES